MVSNGAKPLSMIDPKNKIVLLACPEVSASEEAKLHLLAAAHVLHLRAIEANGQALSYENQSAQLSVMAEGCDDEQLVEVRDVFLAEGLFEVEKSPIDVTSPGGEA